MDKEKLIKNIITDILANGSKKSWKTYSLEMQNKPEAGEACRNVWKKFRLEFFKKGLYFTNMPMDAEWIAKASAALEDSIGEEVFDDIPAGGWKVSKMFQQQSRDGKPIWLKSIERDNKVDAAQDFYDKSVEAFQNIVLKYEPTKHYILPQTKPTNKCLNVFLSDLHIGADIPNSLFGDAYNEGIYLDRIKAVLDFIAKAHKLHGTFHTINIICSGDTTDGAGTNQTVRGTHILEQNMTPHDQFDLFVKSFIDIFSNLVEKGYAANLTFVSATNDNHSGSFGYAASRAIEVYLNAVYPDITTIVSKDFIFHFTTGNKTFIITHGKDDKYMRNGIPMLLQKEHVELIDNYILHRGINKEVPYNTERNHTFLIAGDLHQTHTQYHRRFTYKRIMSFFGASNHVDFNYSKGAGYKGFEHMVFEIDGLETTEGRVFFV